MRLIDADKLSADMYHEAFVKDSDMQKWDSGCWIRYKMFENVLKAQPTVEAPDINVGSIDTTDHDSNVVKKGGNDEDRTTNDLISRQAVLNATSTTLRITGKENAETVYGYIKKLCDDIKALPSVQPFHNITMTDVLKYIDDMPEDVWLEFTCCLECRGWELQRRTAKWCGGDFA